MLQIYTLVMNPKVKTTLILFAILFLFQNNSKARHLLGGEMNYQCVGDSALQFHLRVYRDCNFLSFDDTAILSIYQDNDGDYDLFWSGMTSLVETKDLSPESNACMFTPANYCVQIGDYYSTLLLRNIDRNKRYVVVYQRCCR